ncbi:MULTISPECIES: DUF885 domain-containing protein [Sorangium]|uniref:Secreted protein n=1 Tax=Sorangium cellulosum TaxID=56 RepID=A0A4P2R3U6_SORCE|nr:MULTISPECIES: DUF885 domain-containing protein [Sorangium]AUX37744.1 hypothetical protein SOCE836_099750 [Sorangium cellulosum]WCQ97031.1 hypothetical protein NQZ70_09822 [Sorangium sp. Soce836]
MAAPAPTPARRPRSRRLAALAAALAPLAACSGGASAPPPSAGAAPPAAAPPAAAAPARPEEAPREPFAALRDRILREWAADEPAFARSRGLHEQDGKVGDYSAAAIERRLARLERDRAALAAIDAAALSPDEALDRALLLQQIDLKLFHGRDLEEWRRRPQFYGELFGVNHYLDRAYAPLPERARRLLEHEKAALAQVPRVLENLASPLPKPVLEVAVKIFRGYAEYLRGDVVKLLKGVGDAAFQADFEATNAALADAAERLAEHLAKVELPKGDASHVLGEARYRRLLLAQEGLSMPLAEFKRMGEEDLAANKAAYQELARKVKPTRPKAEQLLAEATRMMEASRRFVVDREIVSLPSDERAIVKETPPYMRWNSAFLDAPGPFERKGLEAFYYITKPDPSWPKREQEEYVMPRGTLLSTTVHEVYPGHFVQGLWVNRAPTEAQRMFESYSFVEGWAHYAEQMMIEQGFGKEDPQSRLGQLADALLRNCRVVVSLGVHAEGMGLDEAERRFVDDCAQDRATAREQALRATFDPGYFAYTLGKLQILKLREEAKAALGPAFSLRRFHDALLAHGSPPLPLIRERVLAELKAPAPPPAK